MRRRTERLNTLIREELSDLLRRQVKDPRLGGFVTITEVSVSPDLRYAKVFVSQIGSEQEKQNTLAALASASGFFRSELAKRLRLRHMPEFQFQWDDSIERGVRIVELIDQVSQHKTDSGE